MLHSPPWETRKRIKMGNKLLFTSSKKEIFPLNLNAALGQPELP